MLKRLLRSPLWRAGDSRAPLRPRRLRRAPPTPTISRARPSPISSRRAPGGGYDTYGRLIARYHAEISAGLARAGAQRAGRRPHHRRQHDLRRAARWADHRHVQHRSHLQSADGPARASSSTSPSSAGSARPSDEIRVMVVSTKSGYKSIDDMLKAQGADQIRRRRRRLGRLSRHPHPRFRASDRHPDRHRASTARKASSACCAAKSSPRSASPARSISSSRTRTAIYALAMSRSRTTCCRAFRRRSQYVKDERGKRLLALLEALSDLGRLTAGPPGIPADVLKVLRDAHEKADARIPSSSPKP